MNAELQHEKILVQNADMPDHAIGYCMIKIRCSECGASSVALVHDGRVLFCPSCGAELRVPKHMRMPKLQRFELVPIEKLTARRHGKLHEKVEYE